MAENGTSREPVEDAAAPPVPLAFPDEQEVFLELPKVIRTVFGEELPLGKIPWGKEQQIINLLKSLMQEMIGSKLLQEPNLTDEEATIKLMAFMFDSAPEKLTTAVCILLDKSKEWVSDHLDLESMLRLLLPFLYSRRQHIMAVVSPFLRVATRTP